MNHKSSDSFFMPKFKCKGVMPMLANELLNKILNNKHTREIPLVFVWECITAFEQSLKELKENEYATTLEQLFDE